MRRRSFLAVSALGLGLAGCLGRQRSLTPSAVPDCHPDCDTPNRSYIFADDSQLLTQRKRVIEGVEPFASAYDEFISVADSTFDDSLEAVTDDDGTDHGPHRFVADTNERADYRAALRMSAAARNFGLAYHFTGDDAYARKVVDVLHHWFLGDDTYMIPDNSIPNANGAIRQHVWMPSFLYGASFVRGHRRWGRYDGSRPWDGGDSGDAESAFRQWVVDWHDTFRASEPDWCPTNNRWPWRIANKAAVAAYLDDDDLMTTAKQMYRAQTRTECADGRTKGRPWADYTDVSPTQGYFEGEIDRENSFQYTGYNLLAHAMCCVAFETWDGTDLWTFDAPGPSDPAPGPTLRKALRWYAPYVRDVDAWEWNTVPVKDEDIEQACTLYELAHTRWNAFDSVLEDPDRIDGRPYWDRRILGPITLTHGIP